MPKRLCWMGLIATMVLVSGVAQAQWTWTPQTGRWVNVKRMPKETAELQVEYARRLMLEGDYKKAIRETNKFASAYSDTDLADNNQYLRGEIRMAQGKQRDAAKEFQKVVSTYPDTELYDDVIKQQYAIGDKLYEDGQAKMQKKWRLFKKRPLKHAIEVYSMVIENQPFTNEAAEAQYKVGLCQFTRKDYTLAAYEYRRVIEDYSSSDWVDEASHGLAVCYYDASLAPEYDQTPSSLAVEAIDDFEARFPSDARVEELKSKRIEMRTKMAEQKLETAKFYEKRREFEAARLTYTVVVDQFADTEVAAVAKQWLDENPAVEHPTPEPLQAGS